jgi:hypothetical protein
MSLPLPWAPHLSTCAGSPRPRRPDDLLKHNCIGLRFTGTGPFHKWKCQVDEHSVIYQGQGNAPA